MTRTKYPDEKSNKPTRRKRTKFPPLDKKAVELRHKAFAREYLINGHNAVQAYMKVYPNVEYNVAGVLGHGLLKKVKVQELIKEYHENIEQTVGISRERVAREYMKLAFNSMAALRQDWVTLKEYNEIPKHIKDCIQEVQNKIDPETGEIIEVRVKMFDKKAALDSLTKFFGYAEPDKYQGTINHNLTINKINTDGLSKPAQELLLEISQKQLTEAVTQN